jgi:hypothetical protein
LPRSRRKRKPKTAAKTSATAKYQGAALLGAKPGAEKPQMLRKKKINIRKGSWDDIHFFTHPQSILIHCVYI